jgi:hypothetical protein
MDDEFWARAELTMSTELPGWRNWWKIVGTTFGSHSTLGHSIKAKLKRGTFCCDVLFGCLMAYELDSVILEEI